MSLAEHLRRTGKAWWGFLRVNWIGTVLILVAALVFFWPYVVRIDSYSEGGDAMFNAWTLARDNHCLVRDGCPSYADGNIYFPHKDTMLYSETQLSAGLVSLPLHWINPNPIFEYNVLTILSYFLSGWFMYLLAKYLSKGREFVSVVAGLIFMLAPIRMASISHLQNLSIFCLPLAVWMILRFFDVCTLSAAGKKLDKAKKAARKRVSISLDTAGAWLERAPGRLRAWLCVVYAESKPGRKYIIGLLIALLYVFFASWVQMIFVLIALGVLLAMLLLVKLVKWRPVFVVLVTMAVATFATLPLAIQYVHFSKTNEATFTLGEQVLYSSDLQDYVMPHTGTLLGKLYYRLHDTGAHNSYNPDSYSYHGVALYLAAFTLLVVAFLWRKKSPEHRKLFAIISTLSVLAIIGFIMSLGPVLKLHGHSSFQAGSMDSPIAMPMPWLLVDFFLPQLSFIRAIGRASIIVLFALCCFLPLLARYPLPGRLSGRGKQILLVVLSAILLFELMPAHRVRMASQDYSYNLAIPKVYEYIKDHKEVDNIVILNADYDYPDAPIPIARAEQVMWAGYHNKNIFNGYSGYTPPKYIAEFEDFVDFKADDIPKLKSRDIRYVLVDKLLMKGKPWVNDRVATQLHTKPYEDARYALYKVE